MRLGRLNQTIHLVEAFSPEETAVCIEHGSTVEIVRELLAPGYKSGIAYIITDGIEAVTVDSSYVDKTVSVDS